MSNVNFNDVVKKIRPPEDMSCLNCPFAIWSKSVATNYQRENDNQGVEYYEERKSYKVVKCYCSKMFKTTYSVGNRVGEIVITDFEYVVQCEGNENE